MRKLLLFYGIFSLLLSAAVAAQAITIDMVTVGNPGNAPDTAVMDDGTTGYGSVGYTYQIGKFEITAGQYTAFLNAVARNSDAYHLYDTAMSSGYIGSAITYDTSTRTYSASLPNEPVLYVTWGSAARFCNWLANGQPTTGIENLSTTEDGSYYLNGATTYSALMAVNRKTNATYVIPNENEWYKAAYYDPNKNGRGAGGYWLYATMSDTPPNNIYPSSGTNSANYYDYNNDIYTLGGSPYTTEVGSFANSKSAYGTLDQDGNIDEWNESLFITPGGAGRCVRGGDYGSPYNELASTCRAGQSPREAGNLGFRIAYVPEPSGIILLLSSMITLFIIWKR